MAIFFNTLQFNYNGQAVLPRILPAGKVMRFFLFWGIRVGALISSNGLGFAQPAAPIPQLTQAELSKLFDGPTLITYSRKAAPIEDVFMEFQKAAGFPQKPNNFENFDAAPPNLTIHWKAMPFWKAGQQLEDLTGWRFAIYSENGLNFIPKQPFYSGDLNGPVAAETPYARILGLSINSNRTRNAWLSAPEEAKAPELMSMLQLGVYTDPKVKVVLARTRDLEVQVKGQAAKPLVSDPNIEREFERGDFSFSRPRIVSLLEVPLQHLAPGTRIAKLSGTARLHVVLEQLVWKAENVTAMTPPTQTVGGIEFKLQSANWEENKGEENGGKRVRGKIDLRRVQKGDFPLTSPGLLSGLVLYDANGVDFYCSLVNQPEQENDDKLSLEFECSPNRQAEIKAPFSLEWKLPPKTKYVDIPFALKDFVIP